MPNAFDTFAMHAAVRAVEATIYVSSGSEVQSKSPSQSFSVAFTYNPGRKPHATELGFAIYEGDDGITARALVTSAMKATPEQWVFVPPGRSNEPTRSESALSAVITPAGTSLETTLGDHGGQIDGTIPANLVEDTSYYGLVAIRQAALEE